MNKVSLTLTGINGEVSEAQVVGALSKLYGKPKEHFEPLCKGLFGKGESYKLLKRVDAPVADQHRAKLEAIGLICLVEPLQGESGLSLVPIDQVAEISGVKCPACEGMSTDAEVCSHCEVVMAKFSKQQNIDVTLQNNLKSADRSYQRMQAAREEEAQRPKKKKPTPRADADPAETVVEDVFNVRVEDSAGGKVIPLAVTAALLAAIGGGYFAYTMNRADVSSYDEQMMVEAEAAAGPGTAESGGAATVVAFEDTYEPTVFGEWRKERFEITQLKHKLELLNSTVGMSATMQGLVANTEDPLVKNIGQQHLLRLSYSDNAERKSIALKEDDQKEVDRALSGITGSIEELPDDLQKVSASINLAETLAQLGRPRQATEAFGQASLYSNSAALLDDKRKKILADTIIAEHLGSRGDMAGSRVRFAAALGAAHSLEALPDNRGAFAYIARSEARAGHFADAHNTLKEVSDPESRHFVMSDIAKYAGLAQEKEPGLEKSVGLVTSNEKMFADDPDLMLLFENDKKMKANAARISTLKEGFKLN